MLSKQTFEQVEYLARHVREQPHLLFGGIQIIAAGDFFQLPPVPSHHYGDSGQYCFESNIFLHTLPHVHVMQNVVRQHEKDFVTAIRELARGTSSKNTDIFMESLQRPIPGNPVKLFARNLERDIHNSLVLLDMPGEFHVFDAVDGGENRSMLRRLKVPVRVSFKVGCKVMLTVNISDSLINGMLGTAVRFDTNTVTVQFTHNNEVHQIGKYRFGVFSQAEGKTKAWREQIPLTPAYALTVHKAQGQTLTCVEVDCFMMYSPGQLAVAISRATHKEGLRVINFNPRASSKPSKLVLDFYENISELPIQADLKCCLENLNTSQEGLNLQPQQHMQLESDHSETGSELCETQLLNIHSMMESKSANTTENVINTAELQESLACLENPPHLQIEDMSSELFYVKAVTEQQSKANNLISSLQQKPETFYTFVIRQTRVVWDILIKACPQIKKLDKIECKNWTTYCANSYQHLTSHEFHSDVGELFETSAAELSEDHLTLAQRIVRVIGRELLSCAAKSYKKVQPTMPEFRQQLEMTEGGRGKVRYVGGSCIAKIKQRYVNSIKRNLASHDKGVFDGIKSKHLCLKMLEQLTTSYAELSSTSMFPETLEETSRRQNVRQALTNISDDAYQFFLSLEHMRTSLETPGTLADHKEGFLQHITAVVLGHTDTFTHWASLLHCAENSNGNPSKAHSETQKAVGLAMQQLQDTVDAVFTTYDDVITLYMRTCDSQFRRSLLQSLGRKKKEAHRRQIQKSKEVKARIASTIQLKTMMTDESEQKTHTHQQLQIAIRMTPGYLQNSYTKKELEVLFAAYALKYSSRKTKGNLCSQLTTKILEVSSMPAPEILAVCCLCLH